MLDIQYIRENHKKVKQAASNKNISVDIDELLTLDQKRRELLQEIEKLRKARNETAAQMKNGIPAPELIAEGRRINGKLHRQKVGSIKSEPQKFLGVDSHI